MGMRKAAYAAYPNRKMVLNIHLKKVLKRGKKENAFENKFTMIQKREYDENSSSSRTSTQA